jgi:hypothetical protein
MKSVSAFTRSDLLGILAAASLLAFLSVPALSNARRVGSAVRCEANMRTLAQAWGLYAQEHNGMFLSNYTAGLIGQQTPRLWAAGYMDWTIAPGNTNISLLSDHRVSLLAPFVRAANVNVYKCAADTYLSPVQRARRFKERVRSVSMNVTVGLGKTGQGPSDPIYAHAGSSADLLYPGPDQTTIFLEEHPDSINDSLIFPPGNGQWLDLPGGLHANAGMATFADGHGELHRWRASLLNRRVSFYFPAITARGRDADISWMSFHSNRRTTRSY